MSEHQSSIRQQQKIARTWLCRRAGGSLLIPQPRTTFRLCLVDIPSVQLSLGDLCMTFEFRKHNSSSFATFAKALLPVQPALPQLSVRAPSHVVQQESHCLPPQIGLIPLPGATFSYAMDPWHFHNTECCFPISCKYSNATSRRAAGVCPGKYLPPATSYLPHVQGQVLETFEGCPVMGLQQVFVVQLFMGLLFWFSGFLSLWHHFCPPLASPLKF